MGRLKICAATFNIILRRNQVEIGTRPIAITVVMQQKNIKGEKLEIYLPERMNVFLYIAILKSKAVLALNLVVASVFDT
jgi:hypothetical protein